MSELRKLGDGEFQAILNEVHKRLGDGRKWPTDEHGRLRFCVRCEEIRPDMDRDVPGWLPPKAHSYRSKDTGQLVWSTRCLPCLKLEAEEMRRREQEANRVAEVEAKAPQIGMRQKNNGAGRKWPWQT